MRITSFGQFFRKGYEMELTASKVAGLTTAAFSIVTRAPSEGPQPVSVDSSPAPDGVVNRIALKDLERLKMRPADGGDTRQFRQLDGRRGPARSGPTTAAACGNGLRFVLRCVREAVRAGTGSEVVYGVCWRADRPFARDRSASDRDPWAAIGHRSFGARTPPVSRRPAGDPSLAR